MRKYIFLLMFACTLLACKTNAQNLFPEKFSGCKTDQFSLEMDTCTANTSDSLVMEVILKSFSDKTKQKIRGALWLQVIVDMEGHSCLISLKNETNIKTTDMELKDTIDKELKWQKPSKKVAALILVNFNDTGAELSRMGFDGNKGLHRLKKTR